MAEMEREASLVRAENHKLRREDNAMVAQKQLMEHSLLEQQKAAKLRSERAKLNAERMRWAAPLLYAALSCPSSSGGGLPA